MFTHQGTANVLNIIGEVVDEYSGEVQLKALLVGYGIDLIAYLFGQRFQ